MSDKPAAPEGASPEGAPETAAPETAAPETAERIRKRSVKIAGHSTSLSLEGVFWDALKDVAAGRGLSLNALIEEIDRGRVTNLSSAVRVFLLNHYRTTAAGTVSPPAPSEETSPLP